MAYFAFEGTADLPIGEWAAEAVSATCSLFVLPAAAPPPWAGEPTEFETADVDDDDTAVILYTSGTTGRPKGAELRHRNMRDNALAGRDLFAADPANPDTYLCVLPLFHSFGQTVVQNGAIAFGGTIVMLPRFEPRAALGLMLQETVTFFAGVPTMYWGLLGALDERVDVSALAARLRVAVSGGSALPGEVHRNFRDRFGITILEGYAPGAPKGFKTWPSPYDEWHQLNLSKKKRGGAYSGDGGTVVIKGKKYSTKTKTRGRGGRRTITAEDVRAAAERARAERVRRDALTPHAATQPLRWPRAVAVRPRRGRAVFPRPRSFQVAHQRFWVTT
ncbi:AMP-binding protein [Amycolatopsis thermoflava]|uniref:AMP-binding protein n=1 Tax=Amycolatopsis thermoflava TaxID=84480 RepID=UPI0037F26548